MIRKIFEQKEGRHLPEVACFILFALAVVTTKVADYDFWWHINLGNQVLREMKILITDSFSYTFSGQKQLNGEWIADLLFALSYQAGGFAGLALLKNIVVFSALYFLYKSLSLDAVPGRREILPILITLVLVLLSIRFRLFFRPATFSYVFVGIFLFAILSYAHSPKLRYLYPLPLLEIIWANTSKGFFFGPLLLTVLGIAVLLERKRDCKPLVFAGLTFFASLINPDSYSLYVQLVKSVIDPSMINVVGEHQPLSLQLLWGYGIKYTFGYQILVALSFIYFVFMGGWRNVLHVLLFAIFLLPTFFLVRMIDFFSLVAAVFAFQPAKVSFTKLSVFTGNKDFPLRIAASAALLFLTLSAVTNRTYAVGLGPKEENIPEKALTFLEKEGIRGRIFNSYPYGGYIAWRSPGQQVFIDGRLNQLYPPAFFSRYIRAIGEEPVWKEEEQKWDFDIAVLEYDRASGGRHFPLHLTENPEWALVYWDRTSTVFLKKKEKFAPVIARYGYRIAKPTFYDFQYLTKLPRNVQPLQYLVELDKEISRQPDNQEPVLAKIFFMYQLGSRLFTEEIEKQLRVCLQLAPDMAIEHSALAQILFKGGRIDEAREEMKKALALDPNDEGAKYLAGKLPSGS